MPVTVQKSSAIGYAHEAASMNRVKTTWLSGGFCLCPEHLALRGGRHRSVPFPATFALLEHPTEGPMLFDTGYSRHFFDATETFPYRLYRWATPVTLQEEDSAVAQLAHRGLSPLDVRRVFISHFHADHISALADFPRAKFVCLRSSFEAVRGQRGWGALRRAHLPSLVPPNFDDRVLWADACSEVGLPPSLAPWTRGFDVVGDGSLLAVRLPGHAQGQMGLVVRDQHEQWQFFIADSVWLKEGLEKNVTPSRFADLLFDDAAAYRATFASLRDLTIRNPEVRLLPSHCQPSFELWGTPRPKTG